MLFFFLLGLRLVSGRPFLAGLCFGAALQAKQTMILPLLPILGVLAQGALTQPHLSYLLRVSGGLMIGFVPLLLPFLIATPADVMHALVVGETRRIINGATNWLIIDAYVQQLFPDHVTAFRAWVMAWSNFLLMGTAFGVVILVLWCRSVRLHSPALYALIALTAWLQVILGKWVAMYYFAIPFTLLALWELIAFPKRPPLLTLGASLLICLGYERPSDVYWLIPATGLLTGGGLILHLTWPQLKRRIVSTANPSSSAQLPL